MKKTKLVSIALIAAVTVSAAGCTDKKKETAQKLTYWATMDGTSAATLTSYSDMMMYREMQKRTGVEIEFIHPVAGSSGQESFTTLLASNDLPDMIETNWNNYPGGPDKAIKDGVIIQLDENLQKYAPNYYSYMEGDKDKEFGGTYKLYSKTDKGHYAGFKTLYVGDIRGFAGLMVRGDLLQKWGMEVPETKDEWEALFEKAKSEGFSKPFTCTSTILSAMDGANTFNTIFDVGTRYYVEDGKIVFAPYQKGYKEYIGLLAEWVKKGYIDKNFITNQQNELQANMTNGTSVACFGYVGSAMGTLLTAMAERDKNYSLVACPYPVMNKGDKARFQECQPDSQEPSIAITKKCKNVEAAMKFCDYLYSEEGGILSSFGIENDTFKKEERNGEIHFVYTDKILKPDKSEASSVMAALYKYMRPANGPGLTQHPDYLDGYYQFEAQKDAVKIWNKNIDEAKKTMWPPLSYTDEESSRKAVISQQYKAKFETGINDIILGKKSISEYDKLIKESKENGFDEMLKIENDAYKRFLKK